MKHYETGRMLARFGRGQDSLLAHITPREAAILKRLGGAGSRNPMTGLLEFHGGGLGGGMGGGGSGGSAPGGDHDADPGENAAAAAAQADAQAAENGAQGFGGTAGDADRANMIATVNTPKPKMHQIPELARRSAINARNHPVAAGLVQGIAAAALPGPVGLLGAGLPGMVERGAFGASPAGFGPSLGDPGPSEPAGDRRGSGGLLSPAPAGGLADTPDPGLAGFAYTDPLTGRVETHRGGPLPWHRWPLR